MNVLLLQLRLALLRRDRMLRHRRIALADIAGRFEDLADGVDLIVGESPNLLQLPEQNFVLLPQRRIGSRRRAQTNHHRKNKQHTRIVR